MTVRTFVIGLVMLVSIQAPTQVPAKEVIFVAGATGGTGIEMVRLLVDAGYDVRGGTRNVERAHERFGDLAEWMTFDALDPVLVDQAVSGADRVVSALGGRGIVGPGSPQFIEYLAVRNLVDASKRHNVKQFVILGAANTGPFEDHRMIPRTGYVLYWKTKGEEYLKDSGVPFTIVGASGLRNEPREGPGVRILPRKNYQWAGYVSRYRVAQVMHAALEDPNALNTAFAVIWDDTVPSGQIRGDFKALQAAESGPRRYEMPKYRW